MHTDSECWCLQLDKVSKELMKTQRQMMRGTLSDAEQEVVVGRVAELEKEAGRLRKVVKASSQPPSRAASPSAPMQPNALADPVHEVGVQQLTSELEILNKQLCDVQLEMLSHKRGSGESRALRAKESEMTTVNGAKHAELKRLRQTLGVSHECDASAGVDGTVIMEVTVESVAEGGSREVDAEEQVRA